MDMPEGVTLYRCSKCPDLTKVEPESTSTSTNIETRKNRNMSECDKELCTAVSTPRCCNFLQSPKASKVTVKPLKKITYSCSWVTITKHYKMAISKRYTSRKYLLNPYVRRAWSNYNMAFNLKSKRNSESEIYCLKYANFTSFVPGTKDFCLENRVVCDKERSMDVSTPIISSNFLQSSKASKLTPKPSQKKISHCGNWVTVTKYYKMAMSKRYTSRNYLLNPYVRRTWSNYNMAFNLKSISETGYNSLKYARCTSFVSGRKDFCLENRVVYGNSESDTSKDQIMIASDVDSACHSTENSPSVAALNLETSVSSATSSTKSNFETKSKNGPSPHFIRQMDYYHRCLVNLLNKLQK